MNSDDGSTHGSGLSQRLDDELGRAMMRAQNGDAAAYRHLLVRLNELAGPYARAFNRRAGWGADSDWEDAVQDILIAVHEKRRTFDASRAFLPWFYAIARFKLIDRFRSRRRIWSRIPNMGDFEIESVADESQMPSLAGRDVERMLESLPEKQRQVLKLVKLEGYSITEAAKELSLSESDVKVSVHRAIKALRGQFEEPENGPENGPNRKKGETT